MDAEGQIILSLSRTLQSLDAIEFLLQQDKAPTPAVLTEKINSYVKEVRGVYESGNAAYYEIPLDLLKVIDGGGEPATFVELQKMQMQQQVGDLEDRAAFLRGLQEQFANVIGFPSVTVSAKKSAGGKRDRDVPVGVPRVASTPRVRGPSSKVLENASSGVYDRR